MRETPDPVSALMNILTKHWVFTLALSDGDAPYPTPLFYALIEPNVVGRHAAPLMIFASDPSSHHGRLCGTGPRPAAGAVYLETDEVGVLRGAQLRGVVVREDRLSSTAAARVRADYLVRHPIAEATLAAGRHQLYALLVRWAKLTDAQLGFGVHPVADFDGSWSEVEQSRT